MTLRRCISCLLLLLPLTSAPGCISSELIADTLDPAPTSDDLLAEAKVTWRNNDLIATEQILRNLVKQDPMHLDARIVLADVYRRLASESGQFAGTEPPAAIAQLEFVAKHRPRDLYIAERLMNAHLGARHEIAARDWALIVARLDKEHPLATQIVAEALADEGNWKLTAPMANRLSRMRRVRSLVVLNLAVRLGRGQNALANFEFDLMQYLQATSFRTHLEWTSLPDEDLPRLLTVLDATVELGTDVAAREDRLGQTLTIISRLIVSESRAEFVPWILNRTAAIVLKTDDLNQGDMLSEVLSPRALNQMLDNRRRFVQMAARLPQEMELDEKTMARVREIESRLDDSH